MREYEIRDVLALFFTILLTLVTASQDFGLTWDETIYFDFSQSIKMWFSLGPSFGEADLRHYWAYDTFANPHPPFMKILSAITSYLDLPLLGFPVNYRLGHYIFSSACLSIVYVLLRSEFGRFYGLLAVCFVVLQPRVFGHLLSGGVDSPTAMVWIVLPLLSWKIVKERAVKPSLNEVLFCMIFSFAVATKFTALLVIIPVLAYFILQRYLRGVLLSVVAFFTALIFLVLVSPEKWHHPLVGISEYLLYPFTRESIPIETFYLGETFPFFLPWHYFDVMTFFTFPLTLWILLPGLLLVRRTDFAFLSALLIPIAFWFVLGHYKGTPKHDVVRQFISLFPLLGLLSWFSFFRAMEHFSEKITGVTLKIVTFLPVIPGGVLALSLLAIHPFELSYYNVFTGGLRGAEKKGLEISYYLEAVNPDVLHYINENLPEEAGLTIYPPWTSLLRLYKSEGLIRNDIEITTPVSKRKADYGVVVRRRAVLDDKEYGRLPALFEVVHEEVSLLKIITLKKQ